MHFDCKMGFCSSVALGSREFIVVFTTAGGDGAA